MRTTVRTYKHSGKVAPQAFILMLLAGLGCSIALGLIYGIVTWLNPFIYINILGTFFFGLAVGKTVEWAGKTGKCRNLTWLTICTLFAVGIGIYISWVAWIFAASEWTLLILFPWDLITVLQGIAQEGAWEIFGYTPTGFVLYAIWLAEASIISIVAVMMCDDVLKKSAFCERCQVWLEQPHSYGPFAALGQAERKQLRAALAQQDYAHLDSLQSLQEGDATFTEVHLQACKSCSDLCLLSVQDVTPSVDDKGNVTFKPEPIVDRLLIRADAFAEIEAQLVALIERLDAAEQEAAEPDDTAAPAAVQ